MIGGARMHNLLQHKYMKYKKYDNFQIQFIRNIFIIIYLKNNNLTNKYFCLIFLRRFIYHLLVALSFAFDENKHVNLTNSAVQLNG